MNVLEALRGLMSGVGDRSTVMGALAEGERMKLLGPDYRQRRALAEAQMARTLEEIEASRDTRSRAGRDDMNALVMEARKAALTQDMPVVEVSTEAGGVGPPAPAPESDTLMGPNGPVALGPRSYRPDVLANLREIEDTKNASQTDQAVEQQRQLGTLPLGRGDRERINLENAGALERTRVAADAAAARMGHGALDPADPEVQAAVQSIADRIARGEITPDAGRGLLGGVRGGLGPDLVKALGDRKVVPAAVRKDLLGVQTTRNLVNEMETLVDKIINSKSADERARNTLLLQQYGQTTGTLLARGFGERGVVTDKDVARATGLVPGWKSANFAPGYAKQEIALLRSVLDLNEKGITEGYFRELPTPGANSGVTLYRYQGRDLPWDQLPTEAQARARALGKAPQ